MLKHEPTPWQRDFLRAPRGASILALTARQCGKTTTAAWAMAHAAVFVPGSLSVVACPAQRQSAEAVRRVRDAILKAGGALKADNVYGLELTNGARVLALPGSDDSIRGLTVDVRLKDGTWARFRAAPMHAPRLPSSLLFYLGLMLTVVAAVVLLAVRSVTRPLRVLGEAARGLGEDLARPPLPEEGPREAREATRAFNEMQARLRGMVEQRTRALSAMNLTVRR